MHSVTSQLRVRYAETDQMGVVYHANYVIWMEIGRVEYFRAQGVRYSDLERDEGILLVVVEAHCRYHSPARYDDEVLVKTWLQEANPRMIRFGYEITEATTGRHMATGETKHVFCGPDYKPKKLPEKYRGAFGIVPHQAPDA
ncbi:MAG TPA: thioesterase family protein [Bryobacteraceae bacterium]|nr:thioesterase family protein [Bryobacteraceae bacterium]